ncbi:hypothetical protein F2P56_007979 [Juglans regia]|uniref:Uncharacterized protein LOC108994927 isoform X2 n=2 Tax=Juglans regia TaxID=51240 RepID=A0A6P9EAT4_JUGRE|nr:uncharacterized protein LOC108994927 isoform X2 [Juglans regia]KAF5476245.1 hypothetical protein F2P56_007979 [Juglans regia]
MRTLPSSTSKIIFDKLVVPPKECLLLRPETCSLLRSQKVVNFGLLHLISVRHKAAHPVVTSLSSKTQIGFLGCKIWKNVKLSFSQADLETAETQSQETCQSKTVHVRFQLQKRCIFGEQFLVVGDDSMFGLWDPASAIPLNWSDGHMWTVELDIPAGKAVKFKFILKEITGNIVWQPGPDRIFQTWETENMVTVCEDWDNAEFQKIIEEEQLADPNEHSMVDSEMMIVSENFSHPKEEVVSHVNQGSAIAYGDTAPDQKPIIEPHKEKFIADNITLPQEKPKAIVADNISYSNENPKVSASSKMFGAIVSDPKEESTAIPNEVAIIAEELLGNNGSVLTVENPGSTHIEGNLINHGDPVLVPGLTPLSKVPNEEASTDESEKTIAFDASVGAYEAKDDFVPEWRSKNQMVKHLNEHLPKFSMMRKKSLRQNLNKSFIYQKEKSSLTQSKSMMMYCKMTCNGVAKHCRSF